MKLLTISEAAERLKIAPISVRRLVREGRLVPVRPLGARAIRFAEQDVNRFIKELRKHGEAALAQRPRDAARS